MASNSRVEGTLRDGLYIKSKPSQYSPGQIARYLDRIQYTPKEHTDETFIADGNFPANLENLTKLKRLHILTFPFENTALHYTRSHLADIDPQSLYHRFIDERKGSYCFGQSNFMINILRGLGYRSYIAAARVNVQRCPEPTDYPPFDHIFIFVQPIPDSNITYLFDPGFNTGPAPPLLFTDTDKSIAFGSTETERFRIARRADPRSSLESRGASNKHLLLAVEAQHINKHNPDPLTAPWVPQFTFHEEEFYGHDVYNASFSYGSTSLSIHGGHQRSNVYVGKYFLLDAKGDLILDPDVAAKELANTDVSKHHVGKVHLFGKELKFVRGSESEVTVIKTESERIGVLKDYFGIIITPEEQAHIRGLPSAIDD